MKQELGVSGDALGVIGSNEICQVRHSRDQFFQKSVDCVITSFAPYDTVRSPWCFLYYSDHVCESLKIYFKGPAPICLLNVRRLELFKGPLQVTTGTAICCRL